MSAPSHFFAHFPLLSPRILHQFHAHFSNDPFERRNQRFGEEETGGGGWVQPAAPEPAQTPSPPLAELYGWASSPFDGFFFREAFLFDPELDPHPFSKRGSDRAYSQQPPGRPGPPPGQLANIWAESETWRISRVPKLTLFANPAPCIFAAEKNTSVDQHAPPLRYLSVWNDPLGWSRKPQLVPFSRGGGGGFRIGLPAGDRVRLDNSAERPPLPLRGPRPALSPGGSLLRVAPFQPANPFASQRREGAGDAMAFPQGTIWLAFCVGNQRMQSILIREHMTTSRGYNIGTSKIIVSDVCPPQWTSTQHSCFCFFCLGPWQCHRIAIFSITEFISTCIYTLTCFHADVSFFSSNPCLPVIRFFKPTCVGSRGSGQVG